MGTESGGSYTTKMAELPKDEAFGMPGLFFAHHLATMKYKDAKTLKSDNESDFPVVRGKWCSMRVK